MFRYVDATNQGDAEALEAFYTEDAVLLPPDHGPVEGRCGIVEFWRQGTDHGLAILTLRVDVQTAISATWWAAIPYRPPSRSRPISASTSSAFGGRQDGSWKVTADIWNSSVASPSPATSSTARATSAPPSIVALAVQLESLTPPKRSLGVSPRSAGYLRT